ncbi:PCYCGC domain-containing protein [Cohnella sp. GbtcB17]|uniref:PCYCGC domain-containing protein n=1 Tax=Cohnella sp. GbtcB17 TaxID=2824762 RepID=UPI001C30B105|nr:PCYCGC domain-containing protein [Cohnella sp. GbtcB17]
MKHGCKSFVLLLVIVLFASACASKKENSHAHEHTDTDLLETTSSSELQPAFLSGQPDEVRTVYRIAAAAKDILEWIPCYCGCGESAGHRSHYNCFIQQTNDDGSVIWTDHGTRCGVCLQIAVQSAQMKQKGASNKEIRTFIDETYKTGFGKPTDTPMPPV